MAENATFPRLVTIGGQNKINQASKFFISWHFDALAAEFDV